MKYIYGQPSWVNPFFKKYLTPDVSENRCFLLYLVAVSYFYDLKPSGGYENKWCLKLTCKV